MRIVIHQNITTVYLVMFAVEMCCGYYDCWMLCV